nr:DUF2703 domain-containing protein [Selenihalanaerobacter shriftii]
MWRDRGRIEKDELTMEEFKENPVQSNIIYIEDQSLEKWIGGEVG